MPDKVPEAALVRAAVAEWEIRMANRAMPRRKPRPKQPDVFLAPRGVAGTIFVRRPGKPKPSPAKTLISLCVTKNFSSNTLKISGTKKRILKSREATINPSSKGKGARSSFPRFLTVWCTALMVGSIEAAPVTITKLSGEEIGGDLKSLENGEFLLSDGKKVALANARSIVFASGSGSREGTESVFLSCGSVIHGIGVVLTNDEKIAFQIAGGASAAFPIDAVRGVRFQPERRDSLFERNLAGKGDPEKDRVYVPQGAELRELAGLLNSLDAEKVVLERSGSLVELPRGKIYGLLFAAALKPDLEGFNDQVRGSDGSTMRGKIASLKEEILFLDMVEGARLSLPLRAIASIRVQPSNLVYVSDVEPESAVVQPVLAPPRAWQRDRNILGGTLQLGRQVFEKGIGMAGGTRLTFANPGTYAKFTALVGIDAGRDKRGDCEIVVLGDGRELERRRLKGGEKPVALDVDVSSVASVVLHVEPGEDYDLSDHVNWCEAAFLKKMGSAK